MTDWLILLRVLIASAACLAAVFLIGGKAGAGIGLILLFVVLLFPTGWPPSREQKIYMLFAIPQVLIAAAVGGALVYFIPDISRLLAGLAGIGAAYALTIWPLKLLARGRVGPKQIDRDI